MSTSFDPLVAAELITARQHDEAITYIDQYRATHPDDAEATRLAALARGGKAEHILDAIDQVGLAPSSTRVDQIVALLKGAVAVDPTLADPYWDLAVVHARFLAQPAVARQYLQQAQALGYQHPMMGRLEAMLRQAGA
jgi:hypothetical protein